MNSRRPLSALGLLVLLAFAHVARVSTAALPSRSTDACDAALGAALADGTLPEHWSSAASPGGPEWQVVDDTAHGAAHALRLADHGTQRYEASNTTPAFVVPTGGSVIAFAQRRDWSWANTAGVLEITVADGDFADIVAAGGKFLDGAYNGRSFASNPLGERPAWTAASGRYTPTRVLLPATLAGQTVRLRLRAGSAGTGDEAAGWFVTNFTCAAP